jgi:tRNA pseudouridine55 synthase
MTTSGLIVLDKPVGWTSHDVVARVRRIAHTRRVGHAGTLDPMASGVLVVGVERATRLLHHLVLADKGYDATIRLGESTVTDDADGAVLDRRGAAGVTSAALAAAIAALTGELAQVPSAVSAIKVDGRRSYARVRAGEEISLPARPVTVSRFDQLDVRPAGECLDVDVEVVCSSGTYVRALARDLGAALGVGGHLTALRRTRVGPFRIAQAVTIDELAALTDPVTFPLAAALRSTMPSRVVTADEARELGFGRPIPAAGLAGTYGALDDAGEAIALLQETGAAARPVLVFRPEA